MVQDHLLGCPRRKQALAIGLNFFAHLVGHDSHGGGMAEYLISSQRIEANTNEWSGLTNGMLISIKTSSNAHIFSGQAAGQNIEPIEICTAA